MNNKKNTHHNATASGFTLVEIVIGIGMLTIFFLANSMYYQQVLEVSEQTTKHIQSGFLIEEGIEAVKLLRDRGWTPYIASLTTGTTYYLSWNGAMWVSTLTPQLIENTFTRSFVISSVERDVNDDIVSTGGVVDPNTRKVVVSVSWTPKNGAATSTKFAETYIMNLFNN